MTELTIRPSNELHNLQAMSTDDLLKALADSLEVTARHLVNLAEIWRELEAREVDLSNLRRGILMFIPMIAHQRILPEAVVNYAGNKTLLNALSRCSLAEQRRLVDENKVTLIEVAGEDYRRDVITLDSISTQEIYKVFGETGLRSEREQIKLIEREPPKKRKTGPRKVRKVQVDEAHHVLLVGNTACDLDRVIQAISEYAGIDLKTLIDEQSRTGA